MTTVDHPTGEDTATRTARCNCGQLSVTLDGPDPERISLCQCYSCQRRTGNVFSVQTRLPQENVTIAGESKTWTFPEPEKPPVDFRSCDSGGATYHFCPHCGSTVFADLAIAPDFVVVQVGTFTDPNFPAPIVSGFEAYGTPWVMSAAELPFKAGRHAYDGTSGGGARI